MRRAGTRRRSHVILLVREHGHRKDGVAQGKFTLTLDMENGEICLTRDPLLKKEASSEALLYKCLGFSELIDREKRT